MHAVISSIQSIGVREADAWSGDNIRSVLLEVQLAGQTWQLWYRHDGQSQP